MQRVGYREQLMGELGARKAANSRYSLRAFAGALGLSPAFLSKVLKGEKGLSLESAAQVADRLGYNPAEITRFVRSVQLGNARSGVLRAALLADATEAPLEEELKPGPAPSADLSLESFRVISDWYHYGILELSALPGFRPEPAYLSRKLGIPADSAKAAFGRIVKLGLLKRDRRGRWVKARALVTTPSDQQSRALRRFHAQMIQKARMALEVQPVGRRDITGITLAINPDKLDLAKREIRAFRRRMARVLDSSRPSAVYQLNIQFFSLTEGAQDACN